MTEQLVLMIVIVSFVVVIVRGGSLWLGLGEHLIELAVETFDVNFHSIVFRRPRGGAVGEMRATGLVRGERRLGQRKM